MATCIESHASILTLPARDPRPAIVGATDFNVTPETLFFVQLLSFVVRLKPSYCEPSTQFPEPRNRLGLTSVQVAYWYG